MMSLMCIVSSCMVKRMPIPLKLLCRSALVGVGRFSVFCRDVYAVRVKFGYDFWDALFYKGVNVGAVDIRCCDYAEYFV